MSDVAAPAPAPAAKAPKVPKASKAPKAPKAKGDKPQGHSYVVIISDAIAALKERSGSSVPAIKKFIESKGEAKALGEGWEKRLALAVKAMAKSGKLVKVKNSFKLGESLKPKAKKVAVKKAPKADGEKKVAKPKAKADPTLKVTKTTKPKKEKKAAAPKKAEGVKKVKKVVTKKPKANKPKAPKATKPKVVKAKKAKVVKAKAPKEAKPKA